MGKNYVENSLKRFLKRKVKITLGFVVAFMINGITAFAIDTIDLNNIPEKYKDRIIKDEKETIILDENYKLIIKDEKEKFKIDGINTLGDDNGAVFYILNSNVKNYGEIRFGQAGETPSGSAISGTRVYVGQGSIYENYGYQNTRTTIDNATYKNYGKIIFTNEAMIVQDGVLENYGYIRGKTRVIRPWGEETVVKNYDTIETTEHYILNTSGNKTGKSYNYGIFKGKKDITASLGDTLYFENYGLIIATDKISRAVSAKTINRGAIVEYDKNSGIYTLYNGGNGKKDEININHECTGNCINSHGTVKDMSNETIISNNTINGADSLFINNKSLKLDLGNKITEKAITTVSQAEGNIVLDNSKENGISGNEHLILDNTTIVGYFEKGGTLLKVDGNLTLENGSIINAITKRDENGDFIINPEEVFAVDVNGELKCDNGQIYGNIKGGEKSIINIEGNSSGTNILNNEIFGKGEINLNNGNWTKGENGSITLDGDKAVVNVDGNLVGYLTKDGDTTTKAGNNILNTTLDGMITGKGTLNVDKIRFDTGDLKINDLEDTFIINGDKDIHVENAIDKIDTSVIFNKEIKDGNVVLTFKSADEMGIHDPVKQKLYNELIKNYGKEAETDEKINEGTIEEIANLVGGIDKLIELMATSGVKITRDIAGAFTDSVNEFDKKANKGEWLTNAKYIGSDMEYDGTSTVNGYESDINSMVGMAEYGISDNTSLGFALGGGDTDIDLKELNGKSTSLDGHNYYAGVYAKHSVNGFDMTGSFGYTISDLDVENGGSADSEAFTLAGYIKRDINLTDTIKLQPNLAFAYDYIKQDTAEMGKGMSINSGDYHIFEADMGMNIVKEIAFEKGNLELKAGIKYSMTNVERNKEITGKYYEADVNLGSPEIDDKKGTAHIGFDYEYETGFGVNGKYETMWSDSGNDSRITAGVSYRF